MNRNVTYIKTAIFFGLSVIFWGCQKLYNPALKKTPGSYLVVEGIINTGNDSTIFNLSKTVAVESANAANPVVGAMVTIESEQHTVWTLPNISDGKYGAPALNLSPSLKYRLRIKTPDGQQYLSDLVAVQPTPPIDSVGYTIQKDGILLYVNTHDPTNKTQYYRWEYSETWMFNSKYEADQVIDTVSHQIVIRLPGHYVFSCFGNDVSNNIFLFSTAALSNDVVFQSPLTNIAFTSEKLETKYSILVRQYGITSDAYQFYALLKKNTEQIGGIFDPQPSQLTGNIHCINDTSQAVIGFVTATNVQTKRIFITNSVVPPTISTIYPYACDLDTGVSTYLVVPPYDFLPVSHLPDGRYLYSTSQCVDCTLRGTTVTPPFWQ